LFSQEKEKHYREVEETALRQKMRSMDESYRASLEDKRQVIRKLNTNLSKLSEK
jgi:hypothetical protein